MISEKTPEDKQKMKGAVIGLFLLAMFLGLGLPELMNYYEGLGKDGETFLSDEIEKGMDTGLNTMFRLAGFGSAIMGGLAFGKYQLQ